MSSLDYMDPINALWSELRGDLESAGQVLALIDLPLDSWHRLQDQLTRGWKRWLLLLPSVIVYSHIVSGQQGHSLGSLLALRGQTFTCLVLINPQPIEGSYVQKCLLKMSNCPGTSIICRLQLKWMHIRTHSQFGSSTINELAWR